MLGAAAICAAIPIAARAQNAAQPAAKTQPPIVSRSAPVLEQSGLRFRDLNRNGQLDPYEDWRLAPAARARDLVSKMTLEEKAGAMMHGTARSGGAMGGAGVGTAYDTAANRALIEGAKVNSLITRLGGDPANLAAQDNELQQLAEGTRLGIPLTISTDPRHHFQYVLGATVTAGQFSQWPETLGLAAIGDRGARAQVRRHRATGVSRRRHPDGVVAAGGSLDRAAMGAHSTAPSARTPLSPAGWSVRTSKDSSMARTAWTRAACSRS